MRSRGRIGPIDATPALTAHIGLETAGSTVLAEVDGGSCTVPCNTPGRCQHAAIVCCYSMLLWDRGIRDRRTSGKLMPLLSRQSRSIAPSATE